MKWLFSFLLLAGPVLAEDVPKHMVSISTSGLGWSYALEEMSTKDRSAFSDITDFQNNVSFNYAHRITERQQIGLFGHFGHFEYTFDRKAGSESRSERETSTLGLYVLHNFSELITEAYYAGLSVSYTNMEEEISEDFSDEEGKAPIETDDLFYTTEAVFGKRFPLTRWNIQNLVYSPQLSVFYRTHGKDFRDQGVKDGWGFGVQPVKFDLLF